MTAFAVCRHSSEVCGAQIICLGAVPITLTCPGLKAGSTQIQLARLLATGRKSLYRIEAAGTKPIGIGQRVERRPLP